MNIVIEGTGNSTLRGSAVRVRDYESRQVLWSVNLGCQSNLSCRCHFRCSVSHVKAGLGKILITRPSLSYIFHLVVYHIYFIPIRPRGHHNSHE